MRKLFVLAIAALMTVPAFAVSSAQKSVEVSGTVLDAIYLTAPDAVVLDTHVAPDGNINGVVTGWSFTTNNAASTAPGYYVTAGGTPGENLSEFGAGYTADSLVLNNTSGTWAGVFSTTYTGTVDTGAKAGEEFKGTIYATVSLD